MPPQKHHREGNASLNFLFEGCREDPVLIMERIRNPPRPNSTSRGIPEGMIKSEMRPIDDDLSTIEIQVRISS